MKYTAGCKYQLYEEVWFQTNIHPHEAILTDWIVLFKNGRIYIKKGYAWDGPSGPTYDSPDTMSPSLVHDAIYQLIRMEMLEPEARTKADELLGQMMRERGSKFAPLGWLQGLRSRVWTGGTKWFAKWAARPGNTKKVYEVQ